MGWGNALHCHNRRPPLHHARRALDLHRHRCRDTRYAYRAATPTVRSATRRPPPPSRMRPSVPFDTGINRGHVHYVTPCRAACQAIRLQTPKNSESSLAHRRSGLIWGRGRFARPGSNAGTGEQRSERHAPPGLLRANESSRRNRAAGPEVLTADLDGVEGWLQQISRRVCGATLERVRVVRPAPRGERAVRPAPRGERPPCLECGGLLRLCLAAALPRGAPAALDSDRRRDDGRLSRGRAGRPCVRTSSSFVSRYRTTSEG